MKCKKEIRKEILEIRNNLSKEVSKNKSKSIISKFIKTKEFLISKNIMVYMDFKNEVNTKELIEYMLKNNKNVIIPYTDMVEVNIIPVEIKSLSDLVYCKYGYLEPKKECVENPFNINEIDLIIVPGVVFDKNRNRVGFGKGYYDKLLYKKRNDVKAIAFAYDFQILESVPFEKHDIKMDKIITESKVIDSMY